jgi:hypothetical protein
MIAAARREIQAARGKPRLEKQARDKLNKAEATLRKIRADFPDLAEEKP